MNFVIFKEKYCNFLVFIIIHQGAPEAATGGVL